MRTYHWYNCKYTFVPAPFGTIYLLVGHWNNEYTWIDKFKFSCIFALRKSFVYASTVLVPSIERNLKLKLPCALKNHLLSGINITQSINSTDKYIYDSIDELSKILRAIIFFCIGYRNTFVDTHIYLQHKYYKKIINWNTPF